MLARAASFFAVANSAIKACAGDFLASPAGRLHARILASVAEYETEIRAERVAAGQTIFEGFRTVRIYNLLARGKVFESIPVHEAVLPIVEQVLDSGCLVSSLSSIAIGPEVRQMTRAVPPSA